MEIGGPCNWPGKRRAFLHHQCSLLFLAYAKAIAKAHFLEAFLFGVMLLLKFSSTMANATTLYHRGSAATTLLDPISAVAATREPSPTPPKL